jgi:hypothetical protein
MIAHLMVRINNRITAWRHPRTEPAGLLLLLARCLQEPSCHQDVAADIGNCQRCGRCPFHDLSGLAAKYGIRVQVASGGRQAVAAVRSAGVRSVVSVACATELAVGLVLVFPKPVWAVEICPGQHPCRGTKVDVDTVERGITFMLKTEQP